MCLKVIGLVPNDLDKAIMLRTDLDACLIKIDELLAALKMITERAAAMELTVLVEQARNKRGIGARFAQTHVGMLTNGDIGVGNKRPAARCLGHIGHKARRAHQTLVDAAGDPQVNSVRIANIIGANQQLLHQQLQSI